MLLLLATCLVALASAPAWERVDGPTALEDAPALSALLAQLDDPDPRLQERAVGPLLDHDPEIVGPALVARLDPQWLRRVVRDGFDTEHYDGAWFQLALIDGLAVIGWTPAIPELARFLRVRQPDVFVSVCYALEALGADDHRRWMRRYLRRGDADLASAFLRMITREELVALREPVERSLHRRRLADVREEALWALSAIGDGGSGAKIERALRRTLRGRALWDGDRVHEIAVAAWALSELDHAPAWGTVREALVALSERATEPLSSHDVRYFLAFAETAAPADEREVWEALLAGAPLEDDARALLTQRLAQLHKT